MSFKIDAKQHFIKVECKAECMPPSQVISSTLKKFPDITRAYHLGDFVTLCTSDDALATHIREFAKKLAASPPMATHRLYVSSIGGLPKEAVKTLCERFGEVEEVVILSPRGNPVAIVVVHSDWTLHAICEAQPGYSLRDAHDNVFECGNLHIVPARARNQPAPNDVKHAPHKTAPRQRSSRDKRPTPTCGPSTGLRGKSGRWNDRGYTFLASAEGEFFCHASALHEDFENCMAWDGEAEALLADTEVLFDVIQDPKDATKLRADNVRPAPPAAIPAGKPVSLPSPGDYAPPGPAAPISTEKPDVQLAPSQTVPTVQDASLALQNLDMSDGAGLREKESEPQPSSSHNPGTNPSPRSRSPARPRSVSPRSADSNPRKVRRTRSRSPPKEPSPSEPTRRRRTPSPRGAPANGPGSSRAHTMQQTAARTEQ